MVSRYLGCGDIRESSGETGIKKGINNEDDNEIVHDSMHRPVGHCMCIYLMCVRGDVIEVRKPLCHKRQQRSGLPN